LLKVRRGPAISDSSYRKDRCQAISRKVEKGGAQDTINHRVELSCGQVLIAWKLRVRGDMQVHRSLTNRKSPSRSHLTFDPGTNIVLQGLDKPLPAPNPVL
jgi:hypothetical protein